MSSECITLPPFGAFKQLKRRLDAGGSLSGNVNTPQLKGLAVKTRASDSRLLRSHGTLDQKDNSPSSSSPSGQLTRH